MFKLNVVEFDRLVQTIENFPNNAEEAINDVLHNEAGEIAQPEIRRLMPTSNKKWKGKKPAAKTSKSMRNINGNLSVTISTTKNYQYLYFPDDGTNTRRHIGNQQFFEKGGEKAQPEIINRCINKITENFN